MSIQTCKTWWLVYFYVNIIDLHIIANVFDDLEYNDDDFDFDDAGWC